MKKIVALPLLALALALSPYYAFANDRATVAGTVRDSLGSLVTGADVSLTSASRTFVRATRTDSQGRFSIAGVPLGSYQLVVSAQGFARHQRAIDLRVAGDHAVEINIEPGHVFEAVTVTAESGLAEDPKSVSQAVNVVDTSAIEQRAKTILAQVANEEVGVHLQRTSPTMSGIFVRGLTGNKVNVFVDGVRYSNSSARGGVNTFLNLVEPSNLSAVEILRGANSAQYGSDAIGGSVQLLAATPAYSNNGVRTSGRIVTYFNSADAGFGSNLSTSFSAETFGLFTNIAGRRVSTVRTGDGIDSHNAVTRFLGLPSNTVIGSRMPDTAFTQYGGMLKASWSPAPDHQLLWNYTRSQQDGGKRYDQLLGGDGNLIADLRNLMLDLFYVKYDTQAAGWFDRVTAAYSFNSQREERVNQGGNGNPRGSITHEYERTSVHGLEAHANKQFESNALLVGGEVYREGIYSPSFSFNPVTASSSLRRGRVPDGARFTSAGIYAQDVYDALPGRLRLVGNLRYSGAWYRVDPDPMGFWPGDSISVGSVSFRAGVVFTPVEEVKFVGNVSRGFRAPHVTDLGTLGLTGSGFEVDSTAVAGRNATIGTTADRNAISSGLPVNQVGPETSLTYEAAVRFRNKRFDTEFGFFVNDIDDSIEKQSLILPAGAVGTQIGGRMITAQTVGGAVFVDASSSPILVRANFTDVRIFGIEHEIEVTLAKSWWLGGNFTYLRARNKSNGLPPNIEGGTPAPEGYIRLRYARPGNRWWFEPFIHLADEQRRLSTLDLEDRRTGATRSRTSIRNFFINGATARGFVGPGPDGRLGTADDLLRSTGETVAQVQNRVLGVGVESAPLFTALPGYAVLSFRGGVKLGEKDDLLFEVENIGDRNYRGISWGQDAPGRGAYLRYRRTL